MASESTVVFNKTWDQQNNDERAQIKKSFKLGNEVAFYRKDYSFIDEEDNTYMPCVAEFTFDGKLAADNSLFGEYDMTIGVRIYTDEFDTEPKSLPTSSFTVTIGEPETDLAAVFEEETTEETSALLESFKEKQRFKLSNVFPDEYDASNDADTMYWGYQWASGGYKVYSEKNAVDRWYWDLAVMLPEKYFTDDRIIYQWLTYEDADGDRELTGAIGCKISVNNAAATKVDQWQGITDLTSESTEVVGKKWYKQARTGKMSAPLYQALFWQDVFTLADIPERSGYKVQHCQAELPLDDGKLPEGITINM